MPCLQRQCLHRISQQCFLIDMRQIRLASLTSAINRGIRRGANNLDRIGTSNRTSEKQTFEARTNNVPRSRIEIERSEQSRRTPHKRWVKEKEPRTNISYEAPQGIPYTTAGSEFLYGTFAVRAALEAGRRQLHKVYIWKGPGELVDEHDRSIETLAKSKTVKLQGVAGSWDKTLMKMSGQRPHNGYVLEASSIPKLPVTVLGKMESPSSTLAVTVPYQSTEDQVVNRVFRVQDSTAEISGISKRRRYPLLLWLDRITDTGNLGAIMRTAYFFGVDAIIIPEHGTAPLSPVTIKASAGTAEYLPILTVKKEVDFVRSSRENGWRFFAAVAPHSASTQYKPQKSQHASVADALDVSPCVLMVGNEGEGLRSFMQKAADESVSIESPHNKTTVVDSLNVSVAAALLIARFFGPTETSALTASDGAQQLKSKSHNSQSSDMF